MWKGNRSFCDKNICICIDKDIYTHTHIYVSASEEMLFVFADHMEQDDLFIFLITKYPVYSVEMQLM